MYYYYSFLYLSPIITLVPLKSVYLSLEMKKSAGFVPRLFRLFNYFTIVISYLLM